jgi:two-component system, cell cycle sensor histidine kinase and response regulator CckA
MTAVDRTEHAGSALKEAIRSLRSVFESLALAALILDERADVVFANDFLLNMIGRERSEVLGKNWIDLVIPDEGKAGYRRAFEMFMTGVELHNPHEREILTRQGERRYIRWNVTYLIGKNGVVEGIASIGEDITELRRARLEIQRAQKFESLGLLAGGIAHDFNNILTVLVGNISVARLKLEGHPDHSDALKYLEAAETASFRATALTGQLLTFARESKSVKKIVRVDDLLRESAGFSTHGSNVQCSFAFPDDLWPVEADEGQLSQVFQNLIINAVQAMPNGGSIRIGAENIETQDDERRFVRITVCDNGVGISAELLPKVFDPYFTTKPTGNGLGLATSYAIVKKHGGKITVNSTLGAGCTFVISLPAADPDSTVVPAEITEAVPGRGRILVLDDEETVRAIATAILEELGYTAECVSSGIEVIPLWQRRKAEGSPFAAVIMDLTIPGGVGGREIADQLLEADPDAKAIVSSGYATDPVMVNYREHGFIAALVKPYRAQEMSKVLQELLGTESL